MFRLKIALLSVLLSGIVLCGLGLYSLSMLKKVGLERIDREILSLGEGRLAIGAPRQYWQNFGKSLSFIYQEKQRNNLVVQVWGPGNELLFSSKNWPASITEDSFPGFDRKMDAPAPSNFPDETQKQPASEAFAACKGKTPGSRSLIIGPQGEILQGNCEQWQGRLVLRPDRNTIGRPLTADNRRRPAPPPPPPLDKPAPHIKRPVFTTITTTTGVWRAGIMGSNRITLLVGMNLASYNEDASRYRDAFLGILPLALLLLAVGGWVIAQRALKPVSLISRTAEEITARALDRRIPTVVTDKELSRLVKVINEMLARLERSFDQAIRFSADAAHELQTPLTILQGELEEAVQHAADGSEEQLRAGSLLEEVQRLKTIVQKLLLLARADAGSLKLNVGPINLSLLTANAAEDAAALAPHLQIEKEIDPDVIVMADLGLMRQLVGNLTSNAVKYNQKNGLVRFRLTSRDGQARLTVANTGPPIPEHDREQIFNRFYRVEQSRSRTVPGAGLGLSLAREIAAAHNGDLCLDPPSGDLISFTLSLSCAG